MESIAAFRTGQSGRGKGARAAQDQTVTPGLTRGPSSSWPPSKEGGFRVKPGMTRRPDARALRNPRRIRSQLLPRRGPVADHLGEAAGLAVAADRRAAVGPLRPGLVLQPADPRR